MANVSYDRSSKVLDQKQPDSYSCAGTCAAMCVMQTTDQLVKDGLSLSPVTFSAVAKKYGYSSTDTSSNVSLSSVLSILKDGYPVITKVASQGSAGASNDHWVVVKKYSGDDSSLKASDFTCTDPASGDTMSLDSAYNYKGIYRTVYYS